MTYKESLFRMAVVGYCNSLPNIEKGTIPANVSFKGNVGDKYIYKVKGIDSLIFEVLYLKDTKQVLVKGYDCSMSVVFE